MKCRLFDVHTELSKCLVCAEPCAGGQAPKDGMQRARGRDQSHKGVSMDSGSGNVSTDPGSRLGKNSPWGWDQEIGM